MGTMPKQQINSNKKPESRVNFHPDILQQSLLEQERKKTIRNLSSVVLSNAFGEDEAQSQIRIDAERLGRAVQDAGLYAYGISAVEVWILNQETGHLVRPGFRQPLRAAGWWTNPAMPRTDALSRLDDPAHADYDDPDPCPPGCDLAGILYASKRFGIARRNTITLASEKQIGRHRKIASAPCYEDVFLDMEGRVDENENFHRDQPFRNETTKLLRSLSLSRKDPHHHGRLFFRDIKSLLQDPDSAKSPRLTLIQDAGFTHATGIHFNAGGEEGIVVYYTNIGSELNAPFLPGSTGADKALANDYYLLRATELIGSAIACIDARRAITVMTRGSIVTMLEALGGNQEYSDLDINQMKATPKFIDKKAIKVWWSKCHGAKLQIPPASSWNEAFFTLMGSLISLLLMSAINSLLIADAGTSISMGPLSSAIAAQYLLTSAPSSQPRTIMLGFAVSGFIAMLFTYIPIWFLPEWTRMGIATACCICAMSKLGINFPPAAGFVFAITSDKHDVTHWLYFMVTVVVSFLLVFPAIVINNLNKNRQYPIYWGNFTFLVCKSFGIKS